MLEASGSRAQINNAPMATRSPFRTRMVGGDSPASAITAFRFASNGRPRLVGGCHRLQRAGSTARGARGAASEDWS